MLPALLALSLSAAPVQAVEDLSASLVEVSGPRARGAGVVVSAEGHVLTSVRFVGLDAAAVHTGGEQRDGTVLAADGRLGVAVVRAAGSGWHAAPAGRTPLSKKGDRVVAVTRAAAGAVAHPGSVLKPPTERRPFLETDLRHPPGTPLFDPRGRLVAVLVDARGRALPLATVRDLLARQAGLAAPGVRSP